MFEELRCYTTCGLILSLPTACLHGNFRKSGFIGEAYDI
jgi:hypothetical protein